MNGRVIWAACITMALVPALSHAGAYIFAGESNGIDLVTHPKGYNGTGGVITVRVCQAAGDGNGPPLATWEQSVHNMIAVYNALQPTTGNLKGLAATGTMDWESVALHEMGHCIGQAHPNAATESGLGGADQNYTKATDGADNAFNVDPGSDGIIGSADDVRGDDVNLHWFRIANNNPFMVDHDTVDASTYARDTVSLPVGDQFATNADRDVGALLLDAIDSESVMQQGSFLYETQRTLGHDDVATLRYGMAGVDETQGSADDYTIELAFSTAPDCDLNLSFNDSQTGFAVCYTGGTFIAAGHVSITSANAYFNSGYNWHFNGTAPCSKTTALTQNAWHMISLPCLAGISSGDTVAALLGDDLGGTYGLDWAVFEWLHGSSAYRMLDAADTMTNGQGYWVKTTLAGQSYTVEGQAPASPDIPLSGSSGGTWNLFGHPYDFAVDWADAQIIDGPDMKDIGTVDTGVEMQRTIHWYNGNTYEAYDDATPGMEGTLEPGKGYWVKVFEQGDGFRLRMRPLATSLSTPTGVGASNGTYPDKIRVSWSDPGEGADSIQINRWDHNGGGSCSGFPDAVYGRVAGNLTQFDDINPIDPDGHCYRVRACWGGEVYPNSNGCSAWSGLYLGTVSGAAVASEQLDELEPPADSVGAVSAGNVLPSRQKMDSRKVRDDGAWYVRIIAETENMIDRGAVLGQLPVSRDGYDRHDLEKRAPFAAPYLSVLFPHEEWGGNAWGYASDYRLLKNKAEGEWVFAVYVSEGAGEVTLSFAGPEEVLRKSRLRRVGERGQAAATGGEPYTFTPQPGYNYFSFRVGGK